MIKSIAPLTVTPTKTVHICELRFQLPLSAAQIPQWRGAVAASAGWGQHHLHNHRGAAKDHYWHRYPLIQYRSVAGQAGIWAMGDGVEMLRAWKRPAVIRLGRWKQRLEMEEWRERRVVLRMSAGWRRYRVRRYLALNAVNHREWLRLSDAAAQRALLGKNLVGHLLGFAGAAGYRLPERLEMRVLRVEGVCGVWIHGHERVLVDVVFETNVCLPEGVALGRSVAFGFGVVEAVQK